MTGRRRRSPISPARRKSSARLPMVDPRIDSPFEKR